MCRYPTYRCVVLEVEKEASVSRKFSLCAYEGYLPFEVSNSGDRKGTESNQTRFQRL